MIAALTPSDQLDPTIKSKSWDVYDDVDEFVAAVMKKMKEIQGRRPSRNKRPPKEPLDEGMVKRVMMAIWHVCFCGAQWRSIAYMTGIPFATLYSFFSRWTRRGLWNELLKDLMREWRLGCGQSPDCPDTLLIDSRSCRSSPTCGQRGIDGGKKIKGIKLHIAVDEHGFPEEMDISTANVHDTNGSIPILKKLSKRGFRGTLEGDSGYRGERLAAKAREMGITILSAACGDGVNFIPQGIRWVVERSFAWLSRYQRLNTIFDRTTESLTAFVKIAFISILSRQIARCKSQ